MLSEIISFPNLLSNYFCHYSNGFGDAQLNVLNFPHNMIVHWVLDFVNLDEYACCSIFGMPQYMYFLQKRSLHHIFRSIIFFDLIVDVCTEIEAFYLLVDLSTTLLYLSSKAFKFSSSNITIISALAAPFAPAVAASFVSFWFSPQPTCICPPMPSNCPSVP